MMGRQTGDQSQLFYLFNLERRIPADHLLRRINPVVTRILAELRDKLASFYSGRLWNCCCCRTCLWAATTLRAREQPEIVARGALRPVNSDFYTSDLKSTSFRLLRCTLRFRNGSTASFRVRAAHVRSCSDRYGIAALRQASLKAEGHFCCSLIQFERTCLLLVNRAAPTLGAWTLMRQTRAAHSAACRWNSGALLLTSARSLRYRRSTAMAAK